MTNTPDHTHVLGRDGFCKTAGCLVMPKATPDPDEVNLCKGCNTMKHLDANGLCGRLKRSGSKADTLSAESARKE